MAQFDKLMEESLRLESLPNPSIRDRSRIRSIDVVSRGIEKQLEEIEARRALKPSIAQTQESVAQLLVPSAATPPMRSDPTLPDVKMVSPPSGKPLTIESLMSGITAGTPEPPPKAIGSQDQPKARPMASTADYPKPKGESAAKQARSESPSRAIPPAVPAIEDRPKSRREAVEESPKERERTPRREPSRERRRQSPSPSREPSHERRRNFSTSRTFPGRETSISTSIQGTFTGKKKKETFSNSAQSVRQSPPRKEKEITPDSSKVKCKESKKEKKKKKESKHRQKYELDEPERGKTEREERSRSTGRPESPHEQRPQVVEASETDDPPAKDGPQLFIQDKPARS